MAVPMSPHEKLKKRLAIFKHQSQKDPALFPGTDAYALFPLPQGIRFVFIPTPFATSFVDANSGSGQRLAIVPQLSSTTSWVCQSTRLLKPLSCSTAKPSIFDLLMAQGHFMLHLWDGDVGVVVVRIRCWIKRMRPPNGGYGDVVGKDEDVTVILSLTSHLARGYYCY